MSQPLHYWTGRGTLCSLDNSTRQKPTHTDDKVRVTCRYCRDLIELNAMQSRTHDVNRQ